MSDPATWVAAVAGAAAALATGGAAWFAAVGLSRERIRRQHAQADQVFAWVEVEKISDHKVRVTVTLGNTGPLPAIAIAVFSVVWPDRTVDATGRVSSKEVDRDLRHHVLLAKIRPPQTQLGPEQTRTYTTVLTAAAAKYSLMHQTRTFLTGAPVQVMLDRLSVRDALQRRWRYYADEVENFIAQDERRPKGIRRLGPHELLSEELKPLPDELAQNEWAAPS